MDKFPNMSDFPIEHYNELKRFVVLNAARVHPEKGDCDRLGTDGWCSICEKELATRQAIETTPPDRDALPSEMTELRDDGYRVYAPTSDGDEECVFEYKYSRHDDAHKIVAELLGAHRRLAAYINRLAIEQDGETGIMVDEIDRLQFRIDNLEIDKRALQNRIRHLEGRTDFLQLSRREQDTLIEALKNQRKPETE